MATGKLSEWEQRLEDRALAPLRGTSRQYIVTISILAAIVAWGIFAYTYQVRDGLYVTGMRDRVMWGLYVTMFVFFIGASMGGTFVSAALRLTDMTWRAPLTRGAEFITVAALVVASLFIFADMGRPERALNILLFGRWESPLVWDVYGLTTYMAGSLIYLYLSALPDLALMRARLGSKLDPFRRLFVNTLTAGWTGNPEQRKALGRALQIMTVIIVPVAVMMHTVTSWIFGMTLREPWDSPMFGIYFVGGAVYSGVGLIIIYMAVLRKSHHLEEYLTERHFLNLAKLLAGAAGVMVFFQVSDLVTSGFKISRESAFNLHQLSSGSMAPIFWTYVWLGLILPLAIVLIPYTRNIGGIVLAAGLANVGMFLERYFIVVGGLRVPLNPYEPPDYVPTWPEASILAGLVSLFVLLIMVMMKLSPSIAVSEIAEEMEAERIAEEKQRQPVVAPQGGSQ